jgi:hypothetical protein
VFFEPAGDVFVQHAGDECLVRHAFFQRPTWMSCKSPADRRMLTRRSLMAVARAAARSLDSSPLVATDFSVPAS